MTTVPYALTGSRPALWYDSYTDRFGLAVRRSYQDQPLGLFSSVDTVTWQVASWDFGDSVVGPSAVGYWADSNNMLVSVR